MQCAQTTQVEGDGAEPPPDNASPTSRCRAGGLVGTGTGSASFTSIVRRSDSAMLSKT